MTLSARPVAAPRRTSLFATACGGMFMFGIVFALLGTLFGLPKMRARLHVNLVQQGDLLLLLFAGILVATLIVGPLIDRYGNKVVLVIASLLVTAALITFSVAQSLAAAALASVILGLGGGGLNTSTNALVSDLYGDARGPMLNLLGIFFGFGALSIPLLAASISTFLSITQLMLLSASLAAVCVLIYGVSGFPPPREEQSFSWRGAFEVFRYPGVVLFACLLFCECGNEASVAGWLSTYIGSLGSSARTATWILAGYWAAMMVGRILAARLLRSIGKGSVVLASGLGAVAGTATLLAARSVFTLATGAVITGLAFAAIYPTVLAMAGDRYQRFAGTVFGVLFSVSLVGGSGFPWAMGHASQSFGVRSGMVLPVASALAITLLTVLIVRRDSEARNT